VIIRFNTIEVDLGQYEIRDNGEPLAVEPKVFDLIIYLIEHRERIISRDELFQKIWDGREVSDTSLSNHIKTARKILRDNGELQHVIKTIRSRGYQFIATVEETSAVSSESVHSQTALEVDSQNNLQTNLQTKETNVSSRFRANNHKWLLWLLLPLVILLWWLASLPSKTNTTQLLVVPFSVSSTDTRAWEPFADQITRELIQSLRKASSIDVVPPPSSFTFKANKIRAHIQNQLPNVSHVLDGVIKETVNGYVRITVELEDITTGKLLWDGDFDVKVNNSNLFEIQNNIATSVSNSLKDIMGEENKNILTKTPTSSIPAYELYVLGQHQFSIMTHASLLRAIDYFSQAIALDPTFEAPYIAKSGAYRFIMTYFDKPADILPKVISSSVDLLSINPKSAQIKSSLGLAYVHAWMWADAWKMLTAANEADPSIALTELGFALYYSAMGNTEGVKRALAKAEKLDPLNQEIADWGIWALAMSNQTNEAIEWGEKQQQLHPKNPYILLGLAIAQYNNKSYNQSIKLALKGVDLSEREPISLIILAQSYAAAGQTSKIQPLIKEASILGQYMCPYETAVIYAMTDQKNKAFELLDEAVAYQSNCLIFTKNDSRLNSLKSDPRYKALLRTIKLDEKSMQNHKLR
jgi:DNA-binding winged helix-turn-helix (wHTH) protein/TolB-like protein/tetratricopeptide (TPR) repeat protein